MQIESIEIKNYRLFRDTKLQNIPRLCVLVGANGTGVLNSTFSVGLRLNYDKRTKTMIHVKNPYSVTIQRTLWNPIANVQ